MSAYAVPAPHSPTLRAGPSLARIFAALLRWPGLHPVPLVLAGAALFGRLAVSV